MANHVALLGAGFSRNWGGWLASEIFDNLLTEPQIQASPFLQNLLIAHNQRGDGYEGALNEVQEAASRSRNADTQHKLIQFQDALRSTFAKMDASFIRMIGIDFSNDRAASVRDFLARFDAIFTLNHDLLLERHYLAAFNPSATRNGAALPGIRQPHPQLGEWEHDQWLASRWTVEDEPPDMTRWARTQPVYKLHGSTNWQPSNGRDLLIMGGQKAKAIRESKLLSWYHDEFARWLSLPNTRLMTIGYSFLDSHINAPILSAKGLGVFIVDPAGMDVGLTARERGAQIPIPSRIKDMKTIGVSKRPLATTFGTDALERTKLMGFFN